MFNGQAFVKIAKEAILAVAKRWSTHDDCDHIGPKSKRSSAPDDDSAAVSICLLLQQPIWSSQIIESHRGLEDTWSNLWGDKVYLVQYSDSPCVIHYWHQLTTLLDQRLTVAPNKIQTLIN